MEKSERYVCIGIDEDLSKVQITSFIRSFTNFLDKRCKQYPDSYKRVSDQMEDDVCVGAEFICDKKLLPPTIFKAPSKKKPMTEEQKKIAGDRLQKGLQKTRKPREKKIKDES